MNLRNVVKPLALADGGLDFGGWLDRNEIALEEALQTDNLPRKLIYDEWVKVRREETPLSRFKAAVTETYKTERDSTDRDDPDFYNGTHGAIQFGVIADALIDNVSEEELRAITSSPEFKARLEKAVAFALISAIGNSWKGRDFSKVIDVDEVTIIDVRSRLTDDIPPA